MLKAILLHHLHPRTADQILIHVLNAPVEDDEFAQLVFDADRSEVAQLLLTVIPERTYTLSKASDPALDFAFGRLRHLFDIAFCLTDEITRRAAAESFLCALSKPDTRTAVIETALFRPKFLQFLELVDCKRMVLHLLSRLQGEMSLRTLDLVDGTEEFLVDTDTLLAWLQAVVIACIASPGETAGAIRGYAARAYSNMSAEQKRIILRKQEAVFRDCERHHNPELGRMLRTLQESWSHHRTEPLLQPPPTWPNEPPRASGDFNQPPGNRGFFHRR